MVDAKVLEAVNFFSAVVRENGIHIHDLILFGSSGLGTASSHSDIDIAIVSADFAGRDIFERALLTKDAEIQTVRKFKVALDVLSLTPEEYRDPASLIAGQSGKESLCRLLHLPEIIRDVRSVPDSLSCRPRAAGPGLW